MTFLKTLTLAASAMVLAACATATPFQAASAPGAYDGYSQTMLESDRVRVNFGGNSLTDRDTVENYLLYRTAQIAVERGFDNFTLTTRDVDEKTRLRSSPGLNSAFYDPYFGYSFYRPRVGWSRIHPYSRFGYYSRFRRRGLGYSFYDPFYDPFFNDFDVREVTKYRATAEAKLGRGPAPDQPNAFDAREVLQNLSTAIAFPEDK